ncbi:MAG TPA: endonuclease/exonuclease/phosphatase family protein [Devosiaceae bacterium]
MIRVATYNIRKSVGTDWRRRPDRVLAVLREIDADVVALQEIDRRFGSRIASLSPGDIVEGAGYQPIDFSVRAQSLGWHGNTILVRNGIRVLDTRRLVLPALEPRGAVLADLEIGSRRLRVVGMHLGLLGTWRRKQADAVLDHLEDLEEPLPTIMMGDLNEWNIWSGCLRHFERHHHIAAPGPSYPSGRPILPHDRIMTTTDLGITNAGVHRSALSRIASDHLPVWAEIDLSALPASQSESLAATADAP